MKTLLLLRHAKSSWDNDRLSDFERPLNNRGREDAPRMGRMLSGLGLTPDLIISSTAKRAATTAELVALSSSCDGDIRYTDALYLAEADEYLAVARRVADNVATLMLVGHNPGLEELVGRLSGHDERMPTAALAAFRLPIDTWRELGRKEPYELIGVWRPKEL